MKPVESFNKKSAKCRECQKAYYREYYKANSEKLKASSAKWSEENSERVRERNKLRYKNNRDKILSSNKKWAAANPEKRATSLKDWREKNPSKTNAYAAKRWAAKLQRTPKWLTDFDKEMIDWTYHCAKLATEKFGEPYHVDHIIPLQGENVSGLHVPGNLQVITASENLSKGNSYHG
jgi:hypothetical protein